MNRPWPRPPMAPMSRLRPSSNIIRPSSISNDTMWKDDVREWPILDFQDICNYFIDAPACDEKPNANYRSIVEGQNYLSSGWIGLIEYKVVGSSITLKGSVRFSQAINSYHRAEVTVNGRKITKVKCDCIASEGNCCSHTAGLAFKIFEASKKGFVSMSATDQPCKWKQSTQLNVLPDTVENIRSTQMTSRENSMLSFEGDSDVIQHLSSPHLQGLSSTPGTLLHQVFSSTKSSKHDVTDVKHGIHGVALDCTVCRQIYYEYVQLSSLEAEALNAKTMNQKCSLWTSQRRRRITSSIAATVPRKMETDPSKWLKNHFSPCFVGNCSTRYGQLNEPHARAQFEIDTGMKVSKSGIMVRPENSWLGASLDGIVDDNTILEIKCPTDKKLAKFDNSVKCLVESGTYDVKVNDNGTYFLRQSTAANGYYTQVQIAMYCSCRKNCKFMVWSPNDYVVANVQYDPKWTEDRIGFLKRFYFLHFLPALMDNVLQNELTLIKLCMS